MIKCLSFCHYMSLSAPKEKPCCTLPTVKKLLEQKRRRETSSLLPSCSTASPNPLPTTTVAVRQHTGSESQQIFQYYGVIVFDFSFFLLSFSNSTAQVRAGRHLHTWLLYTTHCLLCTTHIKRPNQQWNSEHCVCSQKWVKLSGPQSSNCAQKLLCTHHGTMLTLWCDMFHYNDPFYERNALCSV